MLKSVPSRPSDILCFANDWTGDPLSKMHIMRRLAQRRRVLWVDSLGNRKPRATGHDARRALAKLRRFAHGLEEVEPNIWVLSPLVLPVYDSRLAAHANAAFLGATVRAAMAWLGFRRVIDYTFVPASAWVAGRLGEARVVYHCVDEYASFEGAGAQIAALEEKLLRRADLVITCSEPLRERKGRINPRTILLRHGVDHPHFARALDERTPIPAELAALPRPVIGFFGLIAEWIDLGLIARVAAAHPSASVVLVGECRAPLGPLEGLHNVHVLGRRPYADLPGYCRGFDVALLPFTIDDLTVYASPLKLREYLAAGLPVVATDIPESRALAPLVHVGDSAEDFVRGVSECLTLPREERVRRSEAMRGESWDARVAEIDALLERL